MWNEQDHPRDDDGKFTFKNGEISSNTKERDADILYKDDKINREKDKIESEYKSKLLNILGDKVKPTDVLYETTKELEEKVKEYGLEDELIKISFIKGTPTGFGVNNTNQQNIKNNSKEYIKPTSIGKITSPYGNRIHPIYKTTKLHDGIDISVPIGTPVSTVTDGKVIFVGKKTGYGNYIEVQYKNSNGDNITTFYAHLNDFKTKDGKTLKAGQTVKQGEQIGHSGNTGIGTGAHLHLGARKNGEKINPIDIIGNVYPKK